MSLNVSYEGSDYVLDLDDMDTDEARAMERFGVKNLKALEVGIGEGDVSALTVAYWMMLKQNGEPGVRIDRVKFKPIKFIKALQSAAASDTEDGDPKEDEAPSKPVSRKRA